MKTQRLIFFLGFLFCLSTIKAQQESIVLGVKIGGVTSSFGEKSHGTYHLNSPIFVNKLGFLLGIYTQRNLIQNFGAKLEISYIQKGANHIVLHEFTDFYKLEYISIPIFLTYRKGSFEAELGLGTSALIRSKHITTRVVAYNKEYKKNKVDFLLHTGLRWYTKKMSIALRYSQGVVKVVEISEIDSIGLNIPNQPRFYNSNIQFELAFKIK